MGGVGWGWVADGVSICWHQQMDPKPTGPCLICCFQLPAVSFHFLFFSHAHEFPSSCFYGCGRMHLLLGGGREETNIGKKNERASVNQR